MLREIEFGEFANYIDQRKLYPLFLLDSTGFLGNMAIGGSMGLVLNGLLSRVVKDIDLITFENYYNEYTMLNDFSISKQLSSSKFYVDTDIVKCKKIEVMGVQLDLLYNSNITNRATTDYEEVVLTGLRGMPKNHLKINLEDPRVALKYKIKYVDVDKNQNSVMKHKNDIYEIIRNLNI